ncbi:hypothetical protein H9P43_010124 [Blastocladiella emersonii ATCC 22665]|nr:hypothetical protein H9P43_010124 [Blastocladiella emersonii ATCC 22665]
MREVGQPRDLDCNCILASANSTTAPPPQQLECKNDIIIIINTVPVLGALTEDRAASVPVKIKW